MCSCAAAILDHLAIADELSADDAERAMDQLLDMNLNPAVGLQLTHDESETEHPILSERAVQKTQS